MNTEFLEIIKSNPFIPRWVDCTHSLREQARNHRLFVRLERYQLGDLGRRGRRVSWINEENE